MAKLPKSIVILGHTIPIAVKEGIKDGNNEIFGEFNKETMSIELDSKNSDKEMADTLLHEILHAILHITGHSYRLKHKEEEALVRGLESGLAKLVELKCLRR